MGEYYLEIKQNGERLYRMESTRPHTIEGIEIEIGEIEGFKDVPKKRVKIVNDDLIFLNS